MSMPVTLHFKPAAWAEANGDTLLRAVNRLGSDGGFSLDDLCAALATRRRHDVSRFLDRLVGEGLLAREKGHYSLARPLALRGEDPAARRQQQMWNILRGSQARPSIDAAQLATLASTAEVVIKPEQAARYIDALAQARFLRERSAGRFWLPPERNSGPLAPRLMQVRFVLDLNEWRTGRELAAEEVSL